MPRNNQSFLIPAGHRECVTMGQDGLHRGMAENSGAMQSIIGGFTSGGYIDLRWTSKGEGLPASSFQDIWMGNDMKMLFLLSAPGYQCGT